MRSTVVSITSVGVTIRTDVGDLGVGERRGIAFDRIPLDAEYRDVDAGVERHDARRLAVDRDVAQVVLDDVCGGQHPTFGHERADPEPCRRSVARRRRNRH